MRAVILRLGAQVKICDCLLEAIEVFLKLHVHVNEGNRTEGFSVAFR